MKQNNRENTLRLQEQTEKAFINIEIVMKCLSNDTCWNYKLDDNPVWKHVYHMLHSLDQWFINPRIYDEPIIHKYNLNNLYDIHYEYALTYDQLLSYFNSIKSKTYSYFKTLTDDMLLKKPDLCEWDRLTLILAQHRHLHSHLGMLMAVSVIVTGNWPKVIGLE